MTNPKIEKNGDKYWYNTLGQPHREEGPFYEGVRGKVWRIHGQLHREDGPAVEMIDGCKEWYVRGKKIN